MTPEQLQAIRARLDAATPHPWSIRRWKGDDELITNAPTDLRALLDEIERLKAREESLVQQSVAQIGMIGRLQEEVERLKAENIKQFRQGAELMQSAILYILHDYNIDPQAIADIVQMDYPVRPEDWAKRPRSET
jgi:hypothetical protein